MSMETASHQTVRLSEGKHTSPEDGVCVMELASMLAGERFGDHPVSVSRPIAAVLRGYNDWLDRDEERRQTLYAYASRVVGTAAGSDVEDARTNALLAWGDELWSRRRRTPRGWLRARRELRAWVSGPESAARYAVNGLYARGEKTHAEVLAMVDELIEMGGSAGSSTDAGAPGRIVPSNRTGPAGAVAARSR
jgi:hypothetical protein